MATGKFVSYLRVSTERQGRSGLGLEAQRKAVEDFLNGGRWSLIHEYVEVESGKRADRPELARALDQAKATGAKLVIAKLDRLSRDAHFLLGLQKAGVPFVAADMPEANEMVVGIMAVVAEAERKMISQRTKAALAVAKRKGVKLGNPHGARALRRAHKGNKAAVAVVRENATSRAEDLRRTVEDIRASGATSVRTITSALNERGILTPRGGQWHATTTHALLRRLKETKTHAPKS